MHWQVNSADDALPTLSPHQVLEVQAKTSIKLSWMRRFADRQENYSVLPKMLERICDGVGIIGEAGCRYGTWLNLQRITRYRSLSTRYRSLSNWNDWWSHWY